MFLTFRRSLSDDPAHVVSQKTPDCWYLDLATAFWTSSDKNIKGNCH